MKTFILRSLFVLFAAAIFLGVLFYQGKQDSVQVIVQDVPVTKIGVKIRKSQISNNQSLNEPITETLEVVQPTFEDSSEKLEEHNKQEGQGGTNEKIFIDSYLDIASVSEGLVLPELDLSKVYSRIVYPASMHRKNIECSFEIRVFVDKNGNVTYSIPENIHKEFVRSIAKAFKGIKAQPALYKEKPVDVTFILPVEFVLK